MIKLKKYAVPLILIILVPQVVNLLCCWMISSHQMREIPTAIYMGDNSTFSRRVATVFENHETFDITVYTASPEEIPQLIETGKVAFGLVIPRDFFQDIVNGKAPAIMTVVDGSQLSAASFTKISASEILLGLKKELLQEKLRMQFNMTASQAESAASGLVFQNRVLGNPTRNYLNFLMPGMMTAVAQVGLAMAAAAAVDREKRKTLFTYLGSKTLAFTGIGFLSLMMIHLVQTWVFHVPLRSGIIPVAFLSLVFSFSVSATGIMLSTLFWNKVLASQAAAIWFIPSSILSGYTWPLSSMPMFYQKLAWLMPFTHYGETLRNLALKGSSGDYGSQVVFLLASGLVALGIGTAIETFREKMVERRSLHANPA